VRLYSVRMRACRGGRHISGAEGLFVPEEVPAVLRAYARRALVKGAQEVHLRVEALGERPLEASTLALFTLGARDSRQARAWARRLLRALGVSEQAVKEAFRIIGRGGMRGAALLDAQSARRLEPEPSRGVRAKLMGASPRARRLLRQRLRRAGLGHPRTEEALLLASKVARAPGLLAELCVSDEPDYSTGYVASEALGYLRLPHLKGSARGGRVFFLRPGAPVKELIRYLEHTPVLLTRVGPLRGGIIPLDEVPAAHSQPHS
jgi:6-carboxyhexanoate--CoA ligase